ncbi:hypothetical protein J4429_06290 [Candidatus Pacearchaeota archaeon]|nr:hypothetical protein [Candidatus Pacearchaeota archaeon]
MSSTQLSTDELVELTYEAIKSLDLQTRLRHANSGNHVYFLTEKKYTEIYALRGDTCTPDLSGRDYPPSRDIKLFHDFVFRGMYDKKLWGFIPLSEEARKLLEINSKTSHIGIITNGETIATKRPVDKRRVSYNLYH